MKHRNLLILKNLCVDRGVLVRLLKNKAQLTGTVDGAFLFPVNTYWYFNLPCRGFGLFSDSQSGMKIMLLFCP